MMEGSRGSTGLALLSFVAAVGLGYLAYHEHTKGKVAEGDLGRTRSEAQTCGETLQGVKTHSEEADKQLAECSSKQGELDKVAQEMANNLDATRAELVELRQQHADTDKRLAAFKSVAEKLRKMIDAGKLEVTTRKGNMIVKLPAEVLFPSGSAQLQEAGHAPLKELAGVLKQFPDRRFMVAGHTDNVPIGPSNYKSNWELSTARAVTVTEFLASSGVNPARLSAAGYSEYDPIRPNASEAGRSENRRIEIVLLPNVNEISGLAKAAASVSSASPATTLAKAPPKSSN